MPHNIQGPATLMRYMMHCHRREWLESILSQISADKNPGIVKLLVDRYELNQVLIGECSFHIMYLYDVVSTCLVWCHAFLCIGELRRELQSIEAKATDVQIDVTAAMEKFLDHTLRGKAPVQPDDWKVHLYHFLSVT